MELNDYVKALNKFSELDKIHLNMNKINQTSLYCALQEELLNAFLYTVIFYLFVYICVFLNGRSSRST